MTREPEVIDVFAHSRPPVSVENFCLFHLEGLIGAEVPTPEIKRASEKARSVAEAMEVGEALLHQRRMVAGGIAYHRLARKHGLRKS